MNREEYISERLEREIDWYNRYSRLNRYIYKTLRILQIIAASLIPFLSALAFSTDYYRLSATIAVGALGVIVTIATGISSLGRHRENWIEYRRMRENLEREKFLYETEVGPYAGKDRFDLLVQNVETLLAKENMNWSQFMLKSDKPEDAKPE